MQEVWFLQVQVHGIMDVADSKGLLAINCFCTQSSIKDIWKGPRDAFKLSMKLIFPN